MGLLVALLHFILGSVFFARFLLSIRRPNVNCNQTKMWGEVDIFHKICFDILYQNVACINVALEERLFRLLKAVRHSIACVGAAKLAM